MPDATRLPGLADVPELVAELKAGRPVILVDDEVRENEGDLVLAADHVTPEKVAFMIRHTGGVVCLAMTNQMADRLDLPPMVQHNTAKRETAFTVSIEAREGITTGISAQDRATTILTAIRPDARPEDLSRPGHVFPLRARGGRAAARRAHRGRCGALPRAGRHARGAPRGAGARRPLPDARP